MTTDHLSQGIKFLSENGFNLFSIISCSSLSEDFIEYLDKENIDLNKFSNIILIGSGGKRLWEAMHTLPVEPTHPINHFTSKIIDAFIKTYLNATEIISLFPKKPHHFPVQLLGQWVGWNHPSPLGIGIHNKFGLWNAYRSAFMTALDLPETPKEKTISPCSTCIDKPCIKICPAGALTEVKQTIKNFDIVKCSQYRLNKDSNCQIRCLSRMACPVSRKHMYTEPQMAHHYSRSLEVIRQHSNRGQLASPIYPTSP